MIPLRTKTKQVSVRIVPDSRTVEIAPGEAMVDLPPQAEVPKCGIIRWVPQGDGTYRPRLNVMETWIRLPRAGEYGVHIPHDTLIRLATAGFIEAAKPSPMTITLKLESLLAHIEACKDPEFWTEERVATYQKALPRFKD